jgi:hypothetical protein
MLLPWAALSALFIGFYSRVLRSNVLDTMNEDYVRTARAKGLGGRRVLIKHILRASIIPIVALWGLDFAAAIGGGAILTESVFNLHGVWPVRGAVDRRPRRPAGAGHRHVRGLLRGVPERRHRRRLRTAGSSDPVVLTFGSAGPLPAADAAAVVRHTGWT